MIYLEVTSVTFATRARGIVYQGNEYGTSRGALTRILSTETVEGTTGALQSVDNIESRNGFPTAESATRTFLDMVCHDSPLGVLSVSDLSN